MKKLNNFIKGSLISEAAILKHVDLTKAVQDKALLILNSRNLSF